MSLDHADNINTSQIEKPRLHNTEINYNFISFFEDCLRGIIAFTVTDHFDLST